MKRIFIFLLAIGLVATGCQKESYKAEKAFFKANQKFQEASKDAKDNPAALLSVIPDFEQVIDQFPTTPKAAESLRKISQIKAYNKDYDGSRAALARIVQNFSSTGSWAPDARFAIA